MEKLNEFLGHVSSFLWGIPLLILIVGTGIYLTIRVGFLQVRLLPAALKLVFSKNHDKSAEGDISQFQALTTALAATVGTGNIVGVATAVVLGGPGAIFWMWLSAFFGMATKYSEAILAVKISCKRCKRSNGRWSNVLFRTWIKAKMVSCSICNLWCNRSIWYRKWNTIQFCCRSS